MRGKKLRAVPVTCEALCSNYEELQAKLAEAEARADEYYSLNEELLDKVEELEWNYGIAIKEREATITELTAGCRRLEAEYRRLESP